MGVTFGAMTFSDTGTSVLTLDYGFATAPGTFPVTGTATVTNGAASISALSSKLAVGTDSFSVPDLFFTAGTYYLVLQNAITNNGKWVLWDESDGASSASRISPNNGLENNLGSNSFQILGYAAAPSTVIASVVLDTPTVGATPLPGALPLFATGLGALGLIGWRKRKKNRQVTAA